MRLYQLDHANRACFHHRCSTGWRSMQRRCHRPSITPASAAHAEAQAEDLAISVKDLRMSFKAQGATKEVLPLFCDTYPSCVRHAYLNAPLTAKPSLS
jgi:hypothetical protein